MQYKRMVQVTPNNLPHNGVIIREETSYLDMDHKAHIALIISWQDPDTGEFRTSAFDHETGEYLGETFYHVTV